MPFFYSASSILPMFPAQNSRKRSFPIRDSIFFFKKKKPSCSAYWQHNSFFWATIKKIVFKVLHIFIREKKRKYVAKSIWRFLEHSPLTIRLNNFFSLKTVASLCGYESEYLDCDFKTFNAFMYPAGLE